MKILVELHTSALARSQAAVSHCSVDASRVADHANHFVGDLCVGVLTWVTRRFAVD
jgi:hypothetical protein